VIKYSRLIGKFAVKAICRDAMKWGAILQKRKKR